MQLSAVRRAVGLSQEQWARAAATSRPTLSAYEHGHKSPTLHTLDRLLAAAGYVLEARRGSTGRQWRSDEAQSHGFHPPCLGWTPRRLSARWPCRWNWTGRIPAAATTCVTATSGPGSTRSCCERAAQNRSAASSMVCCSPTCGPIWSSRRGSAMRGPDSSNPERTDHDGRTSSGSGRFLPRGHRSYSAITDPLKPSSDFCY